MSLIDIVFIALVIYIIWGYTLLYVGKHKKFKKWSYRVNSEGKWVIAEKFIKRKIYKKWQ